MRVPVEIGKIAASIAVVGALSFFDREARAYERQWHLGVDAGHAALFESGVAGWGGGVHAAYGISDAFNLMLEFDVTKHAGGVLTLKNAGSSDCSKEGVRCYAMETVDSGAVGLAYTLDVARAVPYAGVLVGGYRLGDLAPLSASARASDLAGLAPGGQLAIGLDYDLDRHWAIGAQFRFHAVFLRDVGTVAYATTFLRFEYLWGF